MGKGSRIYQFARSWIPRETRYFGMHVKIEERERGQWHLYEREAVADDWCVTETGQRRFITREAIARAAKWGG